MGNSSPFCLSFSDLLVTLRVLESSGGSLPVSFLASLQGKVVFSLDPSFMVSGNAIADSVASFRLLVVDPIPGSSKDGDSAIPFICRLVGVSDSTPPSVVGASALRSAGVADPVPASPHPPSPWFRLPSCSSPFSSRSSCVVCSCSFYFPWPCSSCSSATFVIRSSSFSFPGRSYAFVRGSFRFTSFFFSSFVRSSPLPDRSSPLLDRSSCPSLFSPLCLLSLFSSRFFRGFLFFLFFSLFSSLFGSSCSSLYLP